MNRLMRLVHPEPHGRLANRLRSLKSFHSRMTALLGPFDVATDPAFETCEKTGFLQTSNEPNDSDSKAPNASYREKGSY